MHIVFLCDDTTKTADANLGICCNLAKEFQSKGHQVTILGNCEQKSAPLEEQQDGIFFRRFYYPINRITHQILQHYGQCHSILHLAADLLCHPITACVDVMRAATGYNPIDRKYTQLLNQVHKAHPVDIAIASSGSFYTIHALAKSQVPCFKIGYMMDPYWKNHTTGGHRAKQEEVFAWKGLDKMVIPKLLERDYQDPAFDECRSKLVASEFPGIQKPADVLCPVKFDPQKINLLFAGNFYESIRSPEYLLNLVEVLPDYVCLSILGGIYGCFPEEVEQKIRQLSEQGRVRLLGCVPAAQAQAAMCHADYLVNLGNAIDNQLPSKIFTYFSTGKPVIHIQKIADCPCVPYMRKYGNAVVLQETEPVAQSAQILLEFMHTDKPTMEFCQVEEKFPECTVPYVADLMLEGVE